MAYLDELDIPSAKERFVGNEALYKKFLFKFSDYTMLQDIEDNLASGNIEAAFRDAHTLKGMVGNLSLNRLMDATSVVTEKLRAGQVPTEAEMTALRDCHQAALDAVTEVKDQNITLF